MTVTEDLERYVHSTTELLGGDNPTKELKRAQALQRLDAGESIDLVAPAVGIGRRHLLTWHEVLQGEGLAPWLGKKQPDAARLKKAKSGIAQMVLGQLAEEHFEALSTEVLGAQGFDMAVRLDRGEI